MFCLNRVLKHVVNTYL